MDGEHSSRCDRSSHVTQSCLVILRRRIARSLRDLPHKFTAFFGVIQDFDSMASGGCGHNLARRLGSLDVRDESSSRYSKLTPNVYLCNRN